MNISSDKEPTLADVMGQLNRMEAKLDELARARQLIRIGEVAAMLGWSVAFAKEMYLKGKLPIAPVNEVPTKNTHLRWRISDVEAYLVNQGKQV